MGWNEDSATIAARYLARAIAKDIALYGSQGIAAESKPALLSALQQEIAEGRALFAVRCAGHEAVFDQVVSALLPLLARREWRITEAAEAEAIGRWDRDNLIDVLIHASAPLITRVLARTRQAFRDRASEELWPVYDAALGALDPLQRPPPRIALTLSFGWALIKDSDIDALGK